ncbi:rho guanine nucleotide exchange factor 15 [Fundulus heteroclitus]|uniref:rho guanine nucleotide exchange factor 15 n=1 Tax=Fundulus heteroclitus TaxID=8078 RepID=UPI00165BFB01|nr:rho guanine nucleotide exchange factor 15 [Fundulus heteroclitus]XP_036002293.1 rho guanine nucleotide exchange factor 15 [Fundulus heteroclitus]
MERPTSPLNPDVKRRPEVPPRSLYSDSRSLVGGGSSSGAAQGQVKEIVRRITKQESIDAGEKLANGAAEPSPRKEVKTPPEVKPRSDVGPQPQAGTKLVAPLAPPLPKKRSRIPKKLTESDGVSTDARRSAPDGKEGAVQTSGAAEAKDEDTLYSTLAHYCSKNCTCMCHLQRPGMMLIWVPVEEHENERPGGTAREAEPREEMGVKGQKAENGLEKEVLREEEEEEGGECELKAENDMDGTEEVDLYRVEEAVDVGRGETKAAEKEVEDHRAEEGCGGIKEVEQGGDGKNKGGDEKTVKSHIHHSLEVLLSEGPRRPSDQTPHAALARCRPVPRHQPPPPPLPSQGPEDEDESIYELHLPGAAEDLKKVPSVRKDLQDSPKITARKPARRERPAKSSSDSTPGVEDAPEPPAILPRLPMNGPGKENTSGRTSPGSVPSSHRLRPEPPKTSPPSSPLVPLRPPPAPPKTFSRSNSTASTRSTIFPGKENKSSEKKVETERSPVRRKTSSKWEFRLTDEPLYQTYSDFAIKKELRRQTVVRNISKTSVDYAMDFAARLSDAMPGKSNNGQGARGSVVPAVSQSTLWQELPAVRDSGMLDQLTADQIKYQESMFEVLTSEASYLRSLRVLTEHFMENRELGETLIISEKKTLFSNIQKVREVSERFLKDLEDHIFMEIVFPDICDIIKYHAQHNFSTYIDYIRNQTYQEKTYTRLMKTNGQFATVINRLQEQPQCQRLPFLSFLLLPFQRITRMRILIESILRRTKEGTTEEQTASKALACVSTIIDQCNKDVGKMKQMEELIETSKMLEFDKLKAIPIISETRYLEKKGELQEMSKSKTFVNMRARFSVVYLFLFNDWLLITAKKSSDRYLVMDHAHRSLVQAQPLGECFGGGTTYENCFNLVMLENHQGRTMERIFKAPSKSDMERWLAALPSATKEEAEEEEVIYEDWDCPQVQCVEQYAAQQADELSLEPTEIINVIRKTNEGWCEGIRLSDGQKGWFPDANVIEITNEHVRRRNIKERYRVSQATRLAKNRSR